MKDRNSRVLLAIICSLSIVFCHSSNPKKSILDAYTILTHYDGKINENLGSKHLQQVPELIITEIMYNSSGTDDEWIELCNFSGTQQILDGSIIKINDSNAFIFPSNIPLNDGECITVALGDNGVPPFNPDCGFITDFGTPTSTNSLNNSSAKIELWDATNNYLIDSVTYNDQDGADGNGASLHLIDYTIDNSNSLSNWQEVQNGGSPSIFSLTSPCATPQLQLKNSSGQIQQCGSFTMDFGSIALGFSHALQFKIENDGNLDLIISSFQLSGDFKIASPNTPFTISSGSSESILVEFSPSINGQLTSALTINSNDVENNQCIIHLKGSGYSPVPEINVEGDIGSFPDISNGDTTPSGIDNTLFASQYIGSSQTKGFIISNIGSAELVLNDIVIEGASASDFSITLAPQLSLGIGESTSFEVTFSPISEGQRNASIIISHNDNDKNPFVFSVRGNGICSLNEFIISPNNGPVGTIVTISGIDVTNSNVYYDETLLDVHLISTEISEVIIPEGAKTSHIKIINPSGCEGYGLFKILEDEKENCEGGFFLDELFISEVTDAGYGSLTYIELYNPTSQDIDLLNYSISIYPNGKTEYNNGYHQPLSGIIKPGEVFVVTSGTDGLLGIAVCSNPGGDGSLGQLISSELPGINKVDNKHDFIGLYKNSTIIDVFGIFGDKNWMLDLPTKIYDDRGFAFKRLNSVADIPSASFKPDQWHILDWKASGVPSCDKYDYETIGTHDYSTAILPSISYQPSLPTSLCDVSAALSVVANEGYLGGATLSYQWYFNVPNTNQWLAISPSDTEYQGQQSADLLIKNISDKQGYQYYVQVNEGFSSCSIISKPVQLKVSETIWNGVSWSKGEPSQQSLAIIEGLYTTGIHGIINACNLLIKKGSELIVSDNTNVDVLQNIYVEGEDGMPGKITIEPKGILIQQDDEAKTVIRGNGVVEVLKNTAAAYHWFEYTYWGSPVSQETIDKVFIDASPNRRFLFKSENFLDALAETNNDNNLQPGQDGIDDDANSWAFAGGLTMIPGVGYITTHDPNKFGNDGSPPYSYTYTFSGPFNNGNIQVPIYRNDAELNDRNWNLLANPYPSPISVDEFIYQNNALDGIIYLWSQGELPSSINNGNEALNFGQNNYAIINGIGEVAGGDKIKPNRFIPSGQGFFVTYSNNGEVDSSNGDIKKGTVVFNNSMRTKGDTHNQQFFKRRIEAKNKLWINLSSESGLFSQTMIAYSFSATNKLDQFILDAPINLSAVSFLSLFSLGSDTEEVIYAIQSRNALSLLNDYRTESIRLGYYSLMSDEELTFSIDDGQGFFFEDFDVYLKDTELGVLHNLSDKDYMFTSKPGYNISRFQIVYLKKGFDGIYDPVSKNDIIIQDLGQNNILFKNNIHQIESIAVLNIQGQQLYKARCRSKSKIITLFNLKSSIYIARIQLANGQVIFKKFVKSL